MLLLYVRNDYSTTPAYALDSAMNKLNKPHLMKMYPEFGNSRYQGHNLIFFGIETWKADVFKFLDENLLR